MEQGFGCLISINFLFGHRNLYLGFGIMDTINPEHALIRPFYQIKYFGILWHRFKKQTESNLTRFRDIALLPEFQSDRSFDRITHGFFITQIYRRCKLEPGINFPPRRTIHDCSRIRHDDFVNSHHACIGIKGLKTGIDGLTFSIHKYWRQDDGQYK